MRSPLKPAARAYKRPFTSSQYGPETPCEAANLSALRSACPEGQRHKIRLLGEYCAGSARGCAVPDPYYGGAEGFETVLDLAEEAAQSLLRHIRENRLQR